MNSYEILSFRITNSLFSSIALGLVYLAGDFLKCMLEMHNACLKNLFTLILIFSQPIICIIAFYLQEIAADNDITFDDNPLDASDGQHSINRRSFDTQADDVPDTDEHWLWSHVHRVKRAWYDDFDLFGLKETSSSESSITATSGTTEQAPHVEEVEQKDFSATEDDIGNESDEDDDDEDIENLIEGSGTPKSVQIPDVPDTKLERFCEHCKFTTIRRTNNNLLIKYVSFSPLKSQR